MSNNNMKDSLRVFVVPVEIMDVPELTIYEQMSYIVLRSFCNPRSDSAFPAVTTIAKLGRMSESTARRSLDGLEQKGLIKVTVRPKYSRNKKVSQDTNLYDLIHPKDAKPIEKAVQMKVVFEGGVPQTGGVVSHRQEGGVPQTGGVVSHRQEGGVPQTPEQYNRTIQIEQYNTTTNEVVVDDNKIMSLKEKIESVLKEPVGVKTLKQLLKKSSEKSITDATLTAVENGKRFGYVKGILNENPSYTRFVSENKKTGDKYDVWYDMYNRS